MSDSSWEFLKIANKGKFIQYDKGGDEDIETQSLKF